MKSLKRGLKLPDFKYESLSSTRIHLPEPARFIEMPLRQHVGAPVAPCVHESDRVLVGTKIADGEDPTSVPLHSSVSGHVLRLNPDSISIESDERDQMDSSIQPRPTVPTDPEELIKIIRDAGVVDLSGSAVPVHTRLAAARTEQIDTLVLNGCESEPFLTSDHVLMLNHAVDILKGAELLRIASGAKRAVLAVEDNKLEAIEILKSKNYNLKIETVEVLTLPVRYPQGSERALTETVTGRRLPWNQTSMAAGVLVEHVATAFATYEAVYLQKPLYERVVTIGGPCILEPKNLWARIGTRSSDLIRSCKGFMREPDRVIFGGPMTGEAISNLETPVTKKVAGILALSSELTQVGEEAPCIRCGLCVDVCPEWLMPETLVRAVRTEKLDLAIEFDMDACTECGLCAYICPSKIPIVSVIRKGKSEQIEKSHREEPAYVVSAKG